MQTIINYLRGSVRLEVSGPFPERFLNLCAQRGVGFWDVEWLDGGAVRLTVPGRDSRRLEPLAEKVLCTLTVLEREGMPFFLGRFRRRYALLVGLACSLAAVCVLSSFILTVEVTGNDKVPTAEIVTELRRLGVRVGAYGPGLDTELITQEALLRLDDLSWMAINLHGTRAEVLVREGIPKPELADDSVCGDVVAEAPGIITHMDVLDGSAAVKEGDTVLAGEVLIGGNMKIQEPEYGTVDLGWRQVRASGRIYARTWRTMSAEIPLEAPVKAYTGEERSFFSLFLLGRRVNFYGNSGISFDQYDKISSTWTMTLPGGREMPLSLTRQTVRAYTLQPVELDRDAARQMLEERLERAVAAALGDGELVSADYAAVERGGVLTVTLTAECREEIGKFVPFPADAPAPITEENEALNS